MHGSATDPHARLCPACAAENPANFTSCWRCQADLSQVPPTAASPEAPSALQAPAVPAPVLPAAPAAGGGRRALVVELVAVQLVAWGWAIPWRIFAETGSQDASQPDAAAQLVWTVSTILFDVAVAVLLLYLIWRTSGSLQAAGLAQLRWWREVAWGAALLAAGFVLVPLAGILADAIQLPRGSGDVPSDEPRAALTAVFFLAAALAEEAIFRVYLITRLEQLFGHGRWAVLTSAILFALYHVPTPARALELFVAGLLLGGAFLVGRRLPRLVLAHWVWNLVIAR